MTPASVAEISPDNFQAWVRVHEKRLKPKVVTMLANNSAGKVAPASLEKPS